MLRGWPMSVIHSAALLAAVLSMSGCVYIPALGRPVYAGRSVPAAVDEVPEMLKAWTREQVLLRIGEPDWTASDGQVYVYNWQVLEGMVVVATYGGGGTIDVTSSQLLLIAFDALGRVCRAERASAKPFQTTWQAVDEWLRAETPPPSP